MSERNLNGDAVVQVPNLAAYLAHTTRRGVLLPVYLASALAGLGEHTVRRRLERKTMVSYRYRGAVLVALADCLAERRSGRPGKTGVNGGTINSDEGR